MQNPYLEKVQRAVDDRVGRPTDELQALALVAIATELQAIRRHLDSSTGPSRCPERATSDVSDRPADGIVIG